MLCSSLSHRDIHCFAFSLLLGLKWKLDVIWQEGKKGRKLLRLEFLFVSWNENSHCRERESKELISSLGLSFTSMLFLLLRTKSLTNCALWNLEYFYSLGVLLHVREIQIYKVNSFFISVKSICLKFLRGRVLNCVL